MGFFILFLFFSSPAFGQSWLDSRLDSVEHRIHLTRPVRVVDFFNYARECYNDSTLVELDRCWHDITPEECASLTNGSLGEYGMRIIWGSGTDPFLCKTQILVCTHNWTHRTPTFEGFTQYLKDKEAIWQMKRLRERVKKKVK